jgi:hypothetical protein
MSFYAHFDAYTSKSPIFLQFWAREPSTDEAQIRTLTVQRWPVPKNTILRGLSIEAIAIKYAYSTHAFPSHLRSRRQNLFVFRLHSIGE